MTNENKKKEDELSKYSKKSKKIGKNGGRDKSKIEEYNPKYQKGCKKLF